MQGSCPTVVSSLIGLQPALLACCLIQLACEASVSNRVIARQVEREQKKILFSALVPTFLMNSRENPYYASYCAVYALKGNVRV